MPGICSPIVTELVRVVLAEALPRENWLIGISVLPMKHLTSICIEVGKVSKVTEVERPYVEVVPLEGFDITS